MNLNRRQYSVTSGVVSGLAFCFLLNFPVVAQFTADYQTNTISGVTSNWSGDYIVGNNTFADALVVQNGGVLSSVNVGYVGYGSSSSNNTVLVTGAGSVWSNSGYALEVGYGGSGNVLTIASGGTVYDLHSFVGESSSSSNNTVLVTGTGSVWTNQGVLTIGDGGGGNQVTIADGGSVYAYWSYLGQGSSNNKVMVTGPGSVWRTGDGLYVGHFTAGNQLIITNGGMVHSQGGTVGYFGDNNAVLVTGSGSVWDCYYLAVGAISAANNLTITDGGTVYSQYGLVGGTGWAGGDNTVLVTGQGSVWSNRYGVTVGGNGSVGNSLVVKNGGTVIASNIFVSPNNLIALDGGRLVVADTLLISSNAVLKGTGTIFANLTLAGTLAPGNSAGAITNFGNLTLQSSAVLDMQLGGTMQGTEYDFILVTNGTVTLDGLLRVSFINGFETNVLSSDTFTLLSADSLLGGSFTNVLNGERLMTVGGEGSFLVTYSGSDLVLSDYEAIPEPSTLALCAVALVTLFAARRGSRTSRT